MRTILILLALLASPAFAGSAIWKWVDHDGVTHYSDTPVDGATRVEIVVGNRWDSTNSAGASGTSTSSSPPGTPGYTTFEIWRPSNEETFSNTSGQVDVRVRVEPELRSGHHLYLYLDGKLVEGFSESTVDFSLKDIDRGAHSVVAVINDQAGKRIAETKPVQFFMQQASLLQPGRQQPSQPGRPK